jgi:predicted kinase
MLVILAGLPGSGKSTLARALAAATNAAILDKDRIRPAVFLDPRDIEYTADQDDFVMELMFAAAEYLWYQNRARIVILDGRTFSRAYQRERAREFAAGQHQEVRTLVCECPEEVAKARLAADSAHPARNRDAALWDRVHAAWEPLDGPHTRLDTTSPTVIDDALAALR